MNSIPTRIDTIESPTTWLEAAWKQIFDVNQEKMLIQQVCHMYPETMPTKMSL